MYGAVWPEFDDKIQARSILAALYLEDTFISACWSKNLPGIVAEKSSFCTELQANGYIVS